MCKTNEKYDPTVHHHKCEYCGAGFASKQEGVQHKLICGPPSNFNDENPTKCAWCNRSFWSSYRMPADSYSAASHAYRCHRNPENWEKYNVKNVQDGFSQTMEAREATVLPMEVN